MTGPITVMQPTDFQFILPGLSKSSELLSSDLWSLKEAVYLIAAGDENTTDKIEIQLKQLHQLPEGVDWNDALDKARKAKQRFQRLAKTAITAGILNDPDRPANWLKWAKSKDYDIRHIEFPGQPQQPQPIQQPTPPTIKASFSSYNNDALVPIKVFAELAGVAESTIYRWYQREIPNLPVKYSYGGQTARYKIQEIESFLSNNTES